MIFAAAIKKIRDFFTPLSLEKVALHYHPKRGNVALLVIDVQKEFCDPRGKRGTKKTKSTSEKIVRLLPAFRKAAIPVYSVHFSYEKNKSIDDIDFYKFRPRKRDALLAKNHDSAFQGSDIHKHLKQNGHKLLLVCGFNLNACVRQTVLDARKKGYDVCILEDLVANDKHNPPENTWLRKAEMEHHGVLFVKSKQMLKQLRKDA